MVAYHSPPLRTDINLTLATEAMLEALSHSYVTGWDGIPSPLPGVPTGFDKLTGKPYSSVIELGFVGPQLRIALGLLWSGLNSSSNYTHLNQAVDMLNAWSSIPGGEGLGHAVWDWRKAGDEAKGGGWIDDDPLGNGTQVYLRRAVVGKLHALEAAALAVRACSDNSSSSSTTTNPWCASGQALRDAQAWQKWGMSLAEILLELQNPDGSFYRQYSVAPPHTCTQCSTTSSPLPIRYLVTAAASAIKKKTTLATTGDPSPYLVSALRAGEYSWSAFHSRDLYVGAAIDNPDVIDKESALFAMDGYLALFEATGNATWLNRSTAAALIASTWTRITNVPTPLDRKGGMDWAEGDSSVGLGLIAVGHSGSDTFDSMFIWPRLALCAATGGDSFHALFGALALANTKQPLDLSGVKGYAQRGFQSELFAFSVGWDIFSGHNDGRGVGDYHFVPWTAANGVYGAARLCMEDLGGLPAACIPEGLVLPRCIKK